MAPRVGFEPTTFRLTVERSTAELSGNSDDFHQGMLSVDGPIATRFDSRKPSNDKLFHGDAIVERMLRIEQHGQRLAAVN